MQDQVNTNKFLFVICTNNSQLLNECLYYIQNLIIPADFEIDVISIPNATSMASAYNEAMISSDAKYKIYLHQDVYILNRNFLSDILSIFQHDAQIGMIGMVGYERISPDGIMWHYPRCGNLYLHNPPIAYPSNNSYSYSLLDDGFTEVALIDGFLMVTAYDFSWNSELLTKWDFYDAFQSLKFLENNYKIVVPVQKYPWCMHDSNLICHLNDYDYFRQAFKQFAKPILGKTLHQIYNFFLSGGKLNKL